jgi:hypothetical protein
MSDEFREPPKSWWTPTKIIIVVALVGVFVLGGIAVLAGLVVVLIPKSQSIAHELDDMNDMRQMVGLIAAETGSGEVAMAVDGRIDVYAVLLKLRQADSNLVEICTSARFGKGPTLAEIRAGDYSEFPYIRRRGAWELGSAREIPLMWDPEPNADDERLVGFSSARAAMVSEVELRALLAASGQ